MRKNLLKKQIPLVAHYFFLNIFYFLSPSVWYLIFFICILYWLRLNYATNNHDPPPSITTHHQQKYIHHHPPLSTTTHHQPKYIHYHPPPAKIYPPLPTISQKLYPPLPTTSPQKPKYIHI